MDTFCGVTGPTSHLHRRCLTCNFVTANPIAASLSNLTVFGSHQHAATCFLTCFLPAHLWSITTVRIVEVKFFPQRILRETDPCRIQITKALFRAAPHSFDPRAIQIVTSSFVQRSLTHPTAQVLQILCPCRHLRKLRSLVNRPANVQLLQHCILLHSLCF